MSNDVKLEPCPFCGGEARVHSPPSDYAGTYIMCGNCCAKTQRFVRPEAAITTWNARHQPQREAALEQALLQCASRFSAYAELHAEKLWDGSLSEAQRQTVRDKVDRNLRYAAEARAALTTPAPAVTEDDQALLADIFAKMEEVLKPLPGELPNALGAAGTRATESGEGDS